MHLKWAPLNERTNDISGKVVVAHFFVSIILKWNMRNIKSQIRSFSNYLYKKISEFLLFFYSTNSFKNSIALECVCCNFQMSRIIIRFKHRAFQKQYALFLVRNNWDSLKFISWLLCSLLFSDKCSDEAENPSYALAKRQCK